MSARLSSTAGRYAACSGRRTLAMSRGHAKGWPRAQPTRGVGSLGRSGYGSGRDCTKEKKLSGRRRRGRQLRSARRAHHAAMSPGHPGVAVGRVGS